MVDGWQIVSVDPSKRKTGGIAELPIFLDNIKTGNKDTILYFDYDEIYQKLEKMGLNYEEIQKLCIDMLYETHKRKVLTAHRLLIYSYF